MSKHLKENHISYINHMKCALSYAKESFKAAAYFSVHAFLPDLCVVKGSHKLAETLQKINARSQK